MNLEKDYLVLNNVWIFDIKKSINFYKYLGECYQLPIAGSIDNRTCSEIYILTEENKNIILSGNFNIYSMPLFHSSYESSHLYKFNNNIYIKENIDNKLEFEIFINNFKNILESGA